MKIRSILTLSLAGAALCLSTLASAQNAYKSEYKMSLVLGPAFPWGKGGKSGPIWSRNALKGVSTSSCTPVCP